MTRLSFSLLLLIIAIAGLIGALVPWLDGLLNHLRPIWAIAGLFLVLACLFPMRRGRRLASLGALSESLAVQLWFLAPSLSGLGYGDKWLPPPADTVTLLQFNTGGYSADRRAIAAFIAQSNPDILMLEEVVPGTYRYLFRQLRDTHPYALHCVYDRICKVAIISRFPLNDGMAWHYGYKTYLKRQPVESPRWQAVDDAPDQNSFGPSLIRAHADLSQRGLPAAVTLMATHWAWPLVKGVQARQRGWMERSIAAEGDAPLILAGDFNATPWSFGFRRFAAASGLTLWSEDIWSWPTFTPALLSIDHILTKNGLRALSVERGPDIGSDHYPILAIIGRAAAPR